MYHDVTVIGAGWSGILATKHMLEEGLSVVALDKREGFGGIWRYSDSPDICTVMKSTSCTSSSTVTEMSDFPMPDELGQFPHHTKIMEYLDAYICRFSLGPHIRCNVTVTGTKKRGSLWQVQTTTSVVYTSRYLVVCTGLTQKPNMAMAGEELKKFTGNMHHSIEIKEMMSEYKGQRLLVIGGGETASDIVGEWLDHMDLVYWSIPNGQHFFRKYASIFPWKPPQPLDKASSRMIKAVAPYHYGKPGLKWICKWTTNGSLLAYQGHGIPEWRNRTPFFHQAINKNSKVLDRVDYQRLTPKGGILKVEGKKVTFVDGSSEEFDVVILCTGYEMDFSVLPERYSQVQPRDRYKYVFDAEDPSIAFIGYVRPIVGAIPTVSEIQSRWAAKVFAKRVQLPPLTEREQAVEEDGQFWRRYLQLSSQRYQTLPLVEGFVYTDDIAKLAGIFPDYWSLFKTDPKGCLIALFSPFSASTFRLNDPAYRHRALAIMNKHRQGTTNPLHLLLILFLRVTFIDWALERLGTVKYHIQISHWWRAIRDFRVVRALDYLWCTPKRLLFDNVSQA